MKEKKRHKHVFSKNIQFSSCNFSFNKNGLAKMVLWLKFLQAQSKSEQQQKLIVNQIPAR